MLSIPTSMLLAALAPQEPGAEPPPAALTVASDGLRRLLADPDSVLFDRPDPDGPWWTRGSNFKASFGASGWSFIPSPLPGDEQLTPIDFRLANVSLGGQRLAITAAMPSRQDRRIVYDHGEVRETIDVDGRGVEQRFVFAELPQRGALQIDVAVTTTLAAEQSENGIRFAGGGMVVTYSRAIAIDAVGQRLELETTVSGSTITLRVPAAFVARAVLPLTIDPRVAYVTVAASNSDLADPDVCGWIVLVPTIPPPFVMRTVWCVVYANYFGANDWDCYVQNYDGDLLPIGAPLVIDFTGEGWSRPRIASLDLNPQALVVAQVQHGAPATRIRGRSMSLMGPVVNPTTGSAFDISFDTVDCLRPDVGGDPTGFTLGIVNYTRFTVVWERAFSSADHDIYARQIDYLGVLGPGPIAINADGLDQTNPSISKSCGRYPFNTTFNDQRIAIVYQQRAPAGDGDIYCAMLTRDGFPVGTSAGYNFPLDTSPHNDTFPQVSSPTMRALDGRRLMLAVYERTSSGNGDIAAVCFDQAGSIVAQANITALENDPVRLSWPQRRPSVDSDGYRFGVAYHEVYQNNLVANDLDTRMSLVALGGNALLMEEPGAILGFSTQREFNVQVASLYSATGSSYRRFCTANDRDNTNNTFAIDARTFDGVPIDTFTTRSTACGTASIAATGHTRLGASMTFTANLPGAPTWLAIGTPASAAIGPCPGCTLGVSDQVMFASPTTIQIPLDMTLIGLHLSAQGLALAPSGAPCLGQLHVTDTIDFTVL